MSLLPLRRGLPVLTHIGRSLFSMALAAAVGASPATATDLSQAHRLYFEGRPGEALETYRAALPDPEAALNAAAVLQDLGRNRESIRVLEKSLAAHPDPRVEGEVAIAALNEGWFDKAKTAFSRVLSTGVAADPAWILGAGRLELESNAFSESERLLSDFSDRRPDLAIGPFYRARLEEEQGNWDGAIIAYQRAVKIDSHFVEVRPALASLFEKKDMPDDAWRQYARAIRANPNAPKANAGLSRVSSRITKNPEQLLPPQRIAQPRNVPPVKDRSLLPVIRVGIGTDAAGNPTRKRTVTFRTSDPFIATDSRGTVLASGPAGESWTVKLAANNLKATLHLPDGKSTATFRGSLIIRQPGAEAPTVIVNSLRFAPGTPWGGMTDKELRGDLEISVRPERRKLVLINHVTVEEYVYGVLAAEMPSHWPMEALKSQAVIARTQAFYRRNVIHLHRRGGYDLCDEQHCQVYTGVSVENDRVRTAVDGTRGEVLAYQDRLAHSVFSSNCAGMTQSGTQAGWGGVAYWHCRPDAPPGVHPPASPWELRQALRSDPPAFCHGSNYVSPAEFRWARVVPAEDIAAKLPRGKRVGRVRQVIVRKRNGSGRVQRVEIQGTAGATTISREHLIRKYLGLGSLRSTMFWVETVVRGGKTHSFIFYGGGWGHGVGLCQSGAAGRADAGSDYRDILSFYFPGTGLERR